MNVRVMLAKVTRFELMLEHAFQQAVIREWQEYARVWGATDIAG